MRLLRCRHDSGVVADRGGVPWAVIRPVSLEGNALKAPRSLVKVAAVLVCGPLLLFVAGTAGASPGNGNDHKPRHTLGYDGGPARGGDDGASIADRAQQYASMRSAPGSAVSAGALIAARGQAAGMPSSGGRWSEQTNSSYNNEPAGFTDPFWSNAGAGFGISGGRVTALVADGRETYAATAGGGVWGTHGNGDKWSPLSDDQASLSTGALAVNPADHSVWIGTGEANTNADSYLGAGVYRLATDGHGGPKGRPVLVGGSALVDHQVYRLLVDGPVVFAATSQGLYRTSSDGNGQWTRCWRPPPPRLPTSTTSPTSP